MEGTSELNIIHDVLEEKPTITSTVEVVDDTPVKLTATTPKKLVYMEPVYKALDIAYQTEENLILYGKGGFSKSLITEQFFKAKGIVPYVKSLGGGTTIDSLYGGMDIGLFLNGKKDEHGKFIKEPGQIE